MSEYSEEIRPLAEEFEASPKILLALERVWKIIHTNCTPHFAAYLPLIRLTPPSFGANLPQTVTHS